MGGCLQSAIAHRVAFFLLEQDYELESYQPETIGFGPTVMMVVALLVLAVLGYLFHLSTKPGTFFWELREHRSACNADHKPQPRRRLRVAQGERAAHARGPRMLPWASSALPASTCACSTSGCCACADRVAPVALPSSERRLPPCRYLRAKIALQQQVLRESRGKLIVERVNIVCNKRGGRPGNRATSPTRSRCSACNFKSATNAESRGGAAITFGARRKEDSKSKEKENKREEKKKRDKEKAREKLRNQEKVEEEDKAALIQGQEGREDSTRDEESGILSEDEALNVSIGELAQFELPRVELPTAEELPPPPAAQPLSELTVAGLESNRLPDPRRGARSPVSAANSAVTSMSEPGPRRGREKRGAVGGASQQRGAFAPFATGGTGGQSVTSRIKQPPPEPKPSTPPLSAGAAPPTWGVRLQRTSEKASERASLKASEKASPRRECVSRVASRATSSRNSPRPATRGEEDETVGLMLRYSPQQYAQVPSPRQVARAEPILERHKEALLSAVRNADWEEVQECHDDYYEGVEEVEQLEQERRML